jgi:F-type H+-transporting ATPase subunit a
MAFSFTSLIPGVGPEYSHVATAGIVSLGLLGAGLVAKRSLVSEGIAPAGKLNIRGFFEFLTDVALSLVDMVIGKHGRKYLPMFAATFSFIWINNLVGMLPGMSPATENINTSLAMGLFMFLAYNYYGFKENGLGYLAHFAGPSLGSLVLTLIITPVIALIEVISNSLRPLTLGLRLSNVLKGDHTVVGVFTDLVPFLVPIPFYALGLLVAFLQAIVFTLLSMVYVSLATSHDH